MLQGGLKDKYVSYLVTFNIKDFLEWKIGKRRKKYWRKNEEKGRKNTFWIQEEEYSSRASTSAFTLHANDWLQFMTLIPALCHL